MDQEYLMSDVYEIDVVADLKPALLHQLRWERDLTTSRDALWSVRFGVHTNPCVFCAGDYRRR